MNDFTCDIKQLANLLKTEKEDSDSEDEDLPGMSKIGPGDIGQRRTHNVSISNEVTSHRPHNHSVSDPDAIWQADEVAMQPIGEERCDPREQPDYEIKYQQSVTTEDVFLQMTGKTASTASCENMVVIIQLKGEKKDAIDLAITNSILDIRSPLYRLHLSLPHPVDAERGRAEWDDKNETLTVQIKMVREFDFINF